jgi:hypothetical protein
MELEPTHKIFGDNFLGVDVARLGEDETVLLSVKRLDHDYIEQIHLEITEKTYLTETVERIKRLNNIYSYKRIYIDDGGMGVGVFDPLLKEKYKVEAINNSARSIDRDNRRKKKLMKEDLYNNLLRLMEQKKICLAKSDEVMLSLKSIQYEYTAEKGIRIFGNYSHITEALVRAAWCVKDKSLNIYIF